MWYCIYIGKEDLWWFSCYFWEFGFRNFLSWKFANKFRWMASRNNEYRVFLKPIFDKRSPVVFLEIIATVFSSFCPTTKAKVTWTFNQIELINLLQNSTITGVYSTRAPETRDKKYCPEVMFIYLKNLMIVYFLIKYFFTIFFQFNIVFFLLLLKNGDEKFYWKCNSI